MERNPVLLVLQRMMQVPLFVEVNGWLLDDLYLLGAGDTRLAAVSAHQEKLFQTAKGIMVSTTGNAKKIADLYKIPHNQIYVQELGANINQFKPGDPAKARKQLKLPLNDPLILFAGSFHLHHDLDTLVEAFDLLLQEYSESQLALLGTGAQFEVIQRKINELSLNDRTILPGACPYEEMPMWFQAADIAILPLTAKKIEQQNGCFSLKLWEYMASGLPVIATDFTNTPSAKLLDDKVLVVPPEETVIMTNAILRLLKEPSLCRQLSAAARSYVLEHRSWRHAAKETIDFIVLRLQGK
jgi:glycosyltransferase involved in cell wall biosynthesis